MSPGHRGQPELSSGLSATSLTLADAPSQRARSTLILDPYQRSLEHGLPEFGGHGPVHGISSMK